MVLRSAQEDRGNPPLQSARGRNIIGMTLSPTNILRANSTLQRETGFEMLRPEAKILFTLQAKGPLSVKEIMSLSGMSYRGFYLVLDRLVGTNLVSVDADEQDRRVRRVRLTEQDTLLFSELAPATD
jgi:DNA-binding MarR family transcriptional regulator